MDGMSFFHVSARFYECGETIGPFTRNDFVARVSATDENVRRMEALFDERKPPHVVSRRNAIFAFETAGYSLAWWAAESRSGRFREFYSQVPNYYEVRLVDAHRAPYYLTTHAMKCMDHDIAAASVADEYWSPALQWRVWEFLGHSAIVVRRVLDAAEDRFGMMNSLWEDRSLAMSRWPYRT